MNFVEVIEDLNSDIYDDFGVKALIDGYEYVYITCGGVDRIEFKGVEIFNSENYQIENSNSVSDMSISEFEDYLESIVSQVGSNFLRYGFTEGCPNETCDAYHARKDVRYINRESYYEVVPECWGTKERDVCSCGGDRTRCDFYPKVREKAKQKNFAVRDWIQGTFENDGTYNESCVNAPIIDRRGKEPIVIGFVSAVNNDKVTGVVWSKNIHKELSMDGKVFSFEIC